MTRSALRSGWVMLAVLAAGTSSAAGWVYDVYANSHASFAAPFYVGVDAANQVYAGWSLPVSDPSQWTSDVVFPYVIKLDRGTGAPLWTYSEEAPLECRGPTGGATAMTVDNGGRVFVALHCDQPTVASLDAGTGTPNWLRSFDGGGYLTYFQDARTDARGDLFGRGLGDQGAGVVKLDGATGSILWFAQLSGFPGGQVLHLALASSGDAVLAGGTLASGGAWAFTVVVLDGSDGHELWRYTRPPTGASAHDVAAAVAVDSSGDVIAVADLDLPSDLEVLKLRGGDGVPVWTRLLSPQSSAAALSSLAVDGSDAILIGGFMSDGQGLGNHRAVVKLSPLDGSDLWRTLLDPDRSALVALDPNDDVLVGGTGYTDYGKPAFQARKLSGATGIPLWRALSDDSRVSFGTAFAADRDGNALVGAVVSWTLWTVAKFSGADGSDFLEVSIFSGNFESGGLDNWSCNSSSTCS